MLTVNAAAELLGVSDDQVRALIAAGRITAVVVSKPGAKLRRYRIEESALDDFKRQSSTRPPEKTTKRRRSPSNYTRYF